MTEYSRQRTVWGEEATTCIHGLKLSKPFCVDCFERAVERAFPPQLELPMKYRSKWRRWLFG